MKALIIQTVFLIFATTLSHYAWATSYNPLLLRAQASIFPKIILLDKDLDEKTANEEITISIISTDQDKNSALQLQGMIMEKYKNKLGDKNLRIITNTFKDFEYSTISTAYILLNGPEQSFTRITNYASSHKRIVFSYDYTDFRHNSLISVYVKEKTYIYANKSAMQLYRVQFIPTFYQIIKII